MVSNIDPFQSSVNDVSQFVLCACILSLSGRILSVLLLNSKEILAHKV